VKQSYYLRASELFPGGSIVRKFTFKTMNTRDNYALLAKANHQIAMSFAVSRGSYVHSQDCFECLSPYNIAA